MFSLAKVLILSNHYNSLRIFRRELIVEIAKKHDVIVSMPSCDKENTDIIRSYGCKVITTEFNRRGMNPVKDIVLFHKYKKLLKEVKPDVVITYTIKPNIYGAMACKAKDIPCYVNVTGLGSAFESRGVVRWLVSLLYKKSLSEAKKVFFENSENKNLFVNDKIIRSGQAVVMPGAGVNLDEFYPCEYKNDDGIVKFLFVGRIMKEKGVDELFYAIRRIKKEFNNISFEFIGWYEDNYKEEVKMLEQGGLIKFYGFQSDVKPFIEQSHCLILPSYHEGMSNTLLEGASMCRALIATNIPGCREAIVDWKTGFLAEVKNKNSLYKAIKNFILLKDEEKKAMGLRGRQHVEKNFDKKMVVEKTIEEMKL